MNAANAAGSSFTPPHAAGAVLPAAPQYGEEDVAIGCECAYPHLQIDVWHSEAPAQPLQELY